MSRARQQRGGVGVADIFAVEHLKRQMLRAAYVGGAARETDLERAEPPERVGGAHRTRSGTRNPL